ncbi:MAG: histidine phosphatase family protein [Burkholderiales bacterium]
MTDTTVIVVRHGETEWNREHRMQGQRDSSLSALGRVQARRLAERLKATPFHALYVSDLQRAIDTARAVVELAPVEPVVDPQLRERAFGIFEGLTAEDMKARYPDEYARFKTRDPDYAVPDGESARAFHQRVIAWYESMARRHPGETVVTVTHGQVLASLFRHAQGIDLAAPRSFELYNAGLNTFVRDAAGWRAAAMNDIRHLGDDALTWA